MINGVVLTGRFFGFNDDGKLLLKVENLQNRQIVKIDISEDTKTKICKFINEKDIIGIKGYIELDDISNIIIIASKITFLSDNKKVQD